MKSIFLASVGLNLMSHVYANQCYDSTNTTSEDICDHDCCSPKPPLYNIDDRVMMIVGLSVICTCLVLTVVIVICCFSSKCPMYNMCRMNYTHGDIIAESKEDDPLNSVMPPEDTYGHNYYSPQVKISAVEDV